MSVVLTWMMVNIFTSSIIKTRVKQEKYMLDIHSFACHWIHLFLKWIIIFKYLQNISWFLLSLKCLQTEHKFQLNLHHLSLENQQQQKKTPVLICSVSQFSCLPVPIHNTAINNFKVATWQIGCEVDKRCAVVQQYRVYLHCK